MQRIRMSSLRYVDFLGRYSPLATNVLGSVSVSSSCS
jgi:hypothetical protein